MKSEKIKRIWRDKEKILEGIANSIVIKEAIEKVAAERRLICESNICGYYDKDGSSPNVFIKGHPACSICGCNTGLLTHSMSSKCSLHELGKDPLWVEELTQEEEDSLPLDSKD